MPTPPSSHFNLHDISTRQPRALPVVEQSPAWTARASSLGLILASAERNPVFAKSEGRIMHSFSYSFLIGWPVLMVIIGKLGRQQTIGAVSAAVN